MNSWINEHDYAEDHNSDSEFDPSEHSDDDISMSDDSDDVQNDHSSEDDAPEVVLQDGQNRNNNDNEEDVEDEEELDEVVAAFMSARSERNRNHPPNLFVGNVSIGGFSFHPNTNVIALGLSNGDISM